MENNTLTDVKVVGRCTGVGVSTDDETVEYNVENYVAEVYDGQWYVGQVLKEVDNDNDKEITFMPRNKDLWQWPSINIGKS